MSWQVVVPTNVTEHAYVRYRDVTGEYMDGRYATVGMQSFGAKWMCGYCESERGLVYEGLALDFHLGRNSNPNGGDTDGDGLTDLQELGGKFEPGETPDECALREVKEETGLTMTEFRLRGLIVFVSDVWGLEYMYLYTATKWRGELVDCDEGDLVWLDKRELLAKKLWEGDRLFLRALDEREEFFMMKFRYEGERLAEVIDSKGISEFRLRVYLELLEIPRGTTVSYGELARRLGCGSPRAVGQALRRNPFAPEIPCHRVVAADGSPCGYGGSRSAEALARKLALLNSERQRH